VPCRRLHSYARKTLRSDDTRVRFLIENRTRDPLHIETRGQTGRSPVLSFAGVNTGKRETSRLSPRFVVRFSGCRRRARHCRCPPVAKSATNGHPATCRRRFSWRIRPRAWAKRQIRRAIVAMQTFGHPDRIVRRMGFDCDAIQSGCDETHSFAKDANEWGTRQSREARID
jgi:hypothetical protein